MSERISKWRGRTDFGTIGTATRSQVQLSIKPREGSEVARGSTIFPGRRLNAFQRARGVQPVFLFLFFFFLIYYVSCIIIILLGGLVPRTERRKGKHTWLVDEWVVWLVGWVGDWVGGWVFVTPHNALFLPPAKFVMFGKGEL